MGTPHNILQYWWHSLRDAERMGFGSDKLSSSKQVQLSAVAVGRVGTAVAAAIYKDHVPVSESVAVRDRQRRAAGIEVIICPLIASRVRSDRNNSGISTDAITPLWVPALLSASSELLPNPAALPWIARVKMQP